jgi:hypothetical protein
VLARGIPRTEARDAIGLYPLFCCADWRELPADLAHLPPDLASLALVPDPFGDYTPEWLSQSFDVVRPFKQRYIVNLDGPPERIVSSHHRKYAEKGLAQLRIERCEDPTLHLSEWVELYEFVCRRHSIHDLRAFSEGAFREQLAAPGVVMFRAMHLDRAVAIHLWMHAGDVAYGHLAGHHPDAYGLHAAYALYWTALKWFHTRAERVDLGAGRHEQPSDGLSFFKRGWSNELRQGWLCGRVVNADLYRSLSATPDRGDVGFFPPYRSPDLSGSGAG